uniref:Uncharacterized protein n=1 Tax=Octopus bimaculoides TaxID=37653 RepID=A0A0L8FTN7_OCTBM
MFSSRFCDREDIQKISQVISDEISYDTTGNLSDFETTDK